MKIFSTYSVKIKHYNKIFQKTVEIYRSAVDFFICVCINEWKDIEQIDFTQRRMAYIEKLCHTTKNNPNPKYNFDKRFYKMPSYLRRGAINEALGKVSSYMSNFSNWKKKPVGRAPSKPKAGFIYPCLYKDNMYERTNTYEAKIKIFVNNTWDWINIFLKKSDVDYILHKCCDRKQCAPTLMKRGKQWFLDFPFEEKVKLKDTNT